MRLADASPLEMYQPPKGPGVRVDDGYEEGQGGENLPSGAGHIFLGFDHGVSQKQEIVLGLFDGMLALLHAGIKQQDQGRYNCKQYQ